MEGACGLGGTAIGGRDGGAAAPACERSEGSGMFKRASPEPLPMTTVSGDTDLMVQPPSISAPTRKGFAGWSPTEMRAAPPPPWVTMPRKARRLTISGAAACGALAAPTAPKARATAWESTAAPRAAPAAGGTARLCTLLAQRAQYTALPAASAHMLSVTSLTASRGETRLDLIAGKADKLSSSPHYH